MQLAFIPIYIKLMGIESFGLIAFYLTLQTVLQILDLGISPTINRELARYSVLSDRIEESRDLVRTLEICYWVVSVLIGLVIVLLAPVIASFWIKAGDLSNDTVQQVVVLMGILAAFQWPLSFYQGGLIGLQRQTLVSGINIATSTLNNGGALLVLIFISPTIYAFFIWRIIAGVFQIGLNTCLLWGNLPKSIRRPRFEMERIRNIWQYSAGMSGIAISAIILTQADKVILSKVLTLENFAYYMLACTIVNGLSLLTGPIFNVIFPKFSSLITAGDDITLRALYHLFTQFMVVIILPIAILLVLFSREIMLIWTNNIIAANCTSPIIAIMVIGTAINALMHLPYTLQIASGWTKIGLIINSVFIVTLVPSIVIMSMNYGGIGAAIVWVVLNLIYMLAGAPITHKYILKGETYKWFIEDIGVPFFFISSVLLIGRQIFTSPMSSLATVMVLLFMLIAAVIAGVLSSNRLRLLAFNYLNKERPV